MKYFLSVLILAVFSLIGVSSAITPVYYSEDKCNIDDDLQNYRTILQDDVIVKAFMQKYPSAISIPSNAIDDSDPPQTSVHYRYEDDETSVNLTLRIFGHGQDPHDCFAPLSYTLNYQNETKTLQITNYANDLEELSDFLNNLVSVIPITRDDILANYENSNTILEGKIISLDNSQNQTKYDVQVEHYYKGKKPSKLITVFDPESSFQKDERVVLYLYQEKGKYLVQAPSFAVDYECNSGSWGSILAPTYTDILMRGTPAHTPLELSEPDSINGLYKAGKPMSIKYNVENFGPMIKHATVTVSIVSDQKIVFSDQRSISVPACSGKVPLSWNFTPESGYYEIEVTVYGAYKVDSKSFQFRDPKVASDFTARNNWAGGSLDKTVYPIIESPLKQLYSAISPNKVVCKAGLELVQKHNGLPACVTSETREKLVQRNWAVGFPMEYIIDRGYWEKTYLLHHTMCANIGVWEKSTEEMKSRTTWRMIDDDLEKIPIIKSMIEYNSRGLYSSPEYPITSTVVSDEIQDQYRHDFERIAKSKSGTSTGYAFSYNGKYYDADFGIC